jgi:hypothetical protein
MSRRTATSATAPAPSPARRNRIVASGEEAPDQLLANPANWRIHPKAQQDALSGALDAVGWVQQVLVNRRSGFVVDGHARVALALSRGACEAFKAAAPRRHRRNAKTNLDHRIKGESYKIEVYEEAIGLAFERVAVSSTLRTSAVAEATRPDAEGGDVLAEARIKREREQAALRFAKDRDLGRLEATMARLDAEAQAAVVRPSRIPTPAEVRAYLESLPDLWAKTSDAGRHAIAEAVFERIDVLGVTDYTFTLTAHAKAHGWDAAFGAGDQSISIGRSGRGERSRADTFQLSVTVVRGSLGSAQIERSA